MSCFHLLFNILQKSSVSSPIAFLLLNFLSLSINSFSQKDLNNLPPKFQNLSYKDGLSNLSIHSICQDDMGYLWIGTARGLNRYDGISFKHFYYNSDESSLYHDDIIEVHKTPLGDILCSTRSGTNVYKFEKEKLIRKQTLSAGFRSFTNYDSTVYATLRLTGLYKINSKSLKPQKVKNFPKNIFTDNLLSDSLSGIWARSTNNKFIINYNPKNSSYKKYYLPNSDSLTVYENMSLVQNHLIISTNSTVNIFDIEKECFESVQEKFGGIETIKDKTIIFIKEVEKDILWIGTKTNGLYVYDIKNQTVKNHPKTDDSNTLNSNHLTCIFKDKTKNIWLGTFDRGLEVAFEGRRNFNFDFDLNNFTKDKFISSICSDTKGNYYIGTRLNGLYIYNIHTKKTSILNKQNSFIHNNNIRSLTLSSKNDLWISTNEKLYLLNLKTKKHKSIELPKPNNGLTNFLESDNKIFAGSDRQGLLVFSLNGELLDTITTFNRNVRQILRQKDGKLIVAAYSAGCFIYDYENNKSQNIRDAIPKQLNLSQIVTVLLDSRENLWIGNFHFGLYRISSDRKKVTVFNIISGLPSNDITGIIEDNNGNIWISTAYGLSMVNNQDKFTTYSYNEGVDNIQFHQKSVHKDNNGYLLFGGNFGLTYFNPMVFKPENKNAPPIFLETLKVLNREVKPDDETQILTKRLALTNDITLTHHYPNFSIEYKGCDYLAGQSLKYTYILEGSDKDWVHANNRTFASYQNLKPGEYVFKVKAKNNNGTWSEKPATLHIKIKPAPWLTVWAFLGYGLILTILIVTSFKFVLYLKHYKRELEIEHNERIRENEISQMKMRFFTNISHEIRTPVTLIKGNVDYLISELSEKKITLKSIGSLKNSTNRLLMLINQLLSFRQLENDALDLEVKNEDIIQISKNMISTFKHTAKLKNISIGLESEFDTKLIPLDCDKFEKILNNLLSNSLKFSKADGNIKVIIEELNSKDLTPEFDVIQNVEKYIKVTVTDNGKGISEKELPYIFNRYTQYSKHNGRPDYSSTGIGLSFSKRLVELHKGSIIAKSKEGIETSICFILPKDKHIYSDIKTIEKETEYKKENNNNIAVSEIQNNTAQQKKVILLAEDDIELNQFIQNAFSNQYKVIATYDGKEALKQAKKILPDIIISDIMMPEMDGITLCKSIREDKLISHIPIVLLTAKTEVENKIAGYNFGADEYITKPFELNILKARIQNLIHQRNILQQYYKQSIPVDYKEETVNQFEINFMKKINNVIEENYANPQFNVHLLAEKIFMSRTSFYRKFMSITNTPPKDYITNYRINKSLELIHSGMESLGEISYLCGFSSQTIFSNSFRKTKGMLPLQYKKSLGKK